MSDITIDNKAIRKKFCSLVALGIVGSHVAGFSASRIDLIS